jgi:hypothetical protein
LGDGLKGLLELSIHVHDSSGNDANQGDAKHQDQHVGVVGIVGSLGLNFLQTGVVQA